MARSTPALRRFALRRCVLLAVAWLAAAATVPATLVVASSSPSGDGTPTETKTAPLLSQSTVKKVRAALVREFKLKPGYGLPCAGCPLGNTIGALLRLPFHDAVGGGGVTNGGGMNGCVDFTVSFSNGLQSIIARLNKVFDRYHAKISRADLWVLAANTAVAYASTTSSEGIGNVPNLGPSPGTLALPFRYGRQDQNSCSGFDTGLIPQPSFTWAQMKQTFVSRVGMTPTELVAIMGAHSVGQATKQAADLAGGWTSSQSTFSNLCVGRGLGREGARETDARSSAATTSSSATRTGRRTRPSST